MDDKQEDIQRLLAKLLYVHGIRHLCQFLGWCRDTDDYKVYTDFMFELSPDEYSVSRKNYFDMLHRLKAYLGDDAKSDNVPGEEAWVRYWKPEPEPEAIQERTEEPVIEKQSWWKRALNFICP